jgi:methyl-accepting chemotaxis protein
MVMARQPTTNDRLQRIEEKVDRLAEAMISVARAEEKISTLMNDHEKMHERLNRLSAKIDDVQRTVDENARTVSIINKLFWAVITAIAIGLASQFMLGA